jgi:hypothetical protein
MTFKVEWNEGPEQQGIGNQQIFAGCTNLIHEFVQSIGGYKILEERDENQIPKCQGITEWAEKQYSISIVDQYTTRIQNHAYLSPNPMDGVDPNVPKWTTAYIPYDDFYTPWGQNCDPTKDELRLFMDPVFVGPRSMADRKFFHSESIKLGLRKKSFNISPTRVAYWNRPYSKCQTPELRRWQEDVSTSRFMFGNSGLESATEWATERGWKEAHFWSTTHLDVDSFEITLPGCEDKPDTYEKLLFVMRFAGKS